MIKAVLLICLGMYSIESSFSREVEKTYSSYDQCVQEYAQPKYDECMELGAEILAEAPLKGITTTTHTLAEGKKLREGGCKRMFDEDLGKCRRDSVKNN